MIFHRCFIYVWTFACQQATYTLLSDTCNTHNSHEGMMILIEYMYLHDTCTLPTHDHEM